MLLILARTIWRLVFCLTIMGIDSANSKIVSAPSGKYPLEVHNMFRDRITHQQQQVEKTVGVWSAWSPWTACSRSCGGGVTQQTRHCVSRPADSRFIRRQRRRRQANGCVGLYKRIRLCNFQECPYPRLDFRTEQCAMFNNRLFKGRTFFWEPYLQAPDECALNCRPLGMNFYATLNKTVIDGTSCTRPFTSYGKRAPKGSRGVCISGSCKSVNANGIIGSVDDPSSSSATAAMQEDCAACSKGTCRSINGLYTRPDLPPGYSLVAQIPQGACRILVQQLKHTRNFLALRNSNGSFILNGDWKITSDRHIQGAGTNFLYVRQDGAASESISSPGPLANPVDILIVNFKTNVGVKYGYSVPIIDPSPPLLKRPQLPETPRLEPRQLNTTLQQRDEAPRPHRRTRLRRRFAWKISGISACSKSCGSGLQATVVTCVREHFQTPVPDRRCAHLEKPQTQPISCNVRDCPAKWESKWTSCSQTCGEGVQRLVPQCVQETSSGRAIPVGDSMCLEPKPNIQSRACLLEQCNHQNGENSRDNELPQTPQVLHQRSSGIAHHHGGSEPSPWMVTDWSQCSVACGTGTQKRYAICSNQNQNCTDGNRPQLERGCSSDKECAGQWFTGPWSSCSDSCDLGVGRQTREVFCIVKIRGQSHITNEMTCSVSEKPIWEQSCHGQCPAKWFTGDWGACDGQCLNNHGVQRREVKCMDVDGKESDGCKEDEMPMAKRQCVCMEEQRDKFKPVQDEPTVDRFCVDRIRNCYLAVQARLCQYPYYTNHCCMSCKRTQLDHSE